MRYRERDGSLCLVTTAKPMGLIRCGDESDLRSSSWPVAGVPARRKYGELDATLYLEQIETILNDLHVDGLNDLPVRHLEHPKLVNARRLGTGNRLLDIRPNQPPEIQARKGLCVIGDLSQGRTEANEVPIRVHSRTLRFP